MDNDHWAGHLFPWAEANCQGVEGTERHPRGHLPASGVGPERPRPRPLFIKVQACLRPRNHQPRVVFSPLSTRAGDPGTSLHAAGRGARTVTCQVSLKDARSPSSASCFLKHQGLPQGGPKRPDSTKSALLAPCTHSLPQRRATHPGLRPPHRPTFLSLLRPRPAPAATPTRCCRHACTPQATPTADH